MHHIISDAHPTSNFPKYYMSSTRRNISSLQCPFFYAVSLRQSLPATIDQYTQRAKVRSMYVIIETDHKLADCANTRSDMADRGTLRSFQSMFVPCQADKCILSQRSAEGDHIGVLYVTMWQGNWASGLYFTHYCQVQDSPCNMMRLSAFVVLFEELYSVLRSCCDHDMLEYNVRTFARPL